MIGREERSVDRSKGSRMGKQGTRGEGKKIESTGKK